MSASRPRRLGHAALTAVAVGGLAVLLAACGTGPIPGGGSSPGASSSPGAPTSSGGCSAASAQSTLTIDATNALRFVPASACLKAGGTITWKNVGDITHTTTDDVSLAAKASDAALPTGATSWNHTLPGGASWSLKLTVAGTYKYFCIPHETLGMVASITVVSASSSQSSSSPGTSTSSSGCSAASAQSTITIDATNALRFVPSSACLKAGGTVTWKNVGDITHTTTDDASLAAKASDAALPSGASSWNHTLPGGASWSLKLTAAGTYKYFCIPHETLGMVASITVVT